MRISITNSGVVDVGPARLGVMWVYGSPLQASIAVMPHSGDEGDDYVVSPGDTFPVCGELWRCVDLEYRQDDQVRQDDHAGEYLAGDRFRVTLEPADYGPAPDLQPFGRLDEAQLQTLESRLGQRLPPVYRSWLAATNGAVPATPHHIPGLHFVLFPEDALLGVHPEDLGLDLGEMDGLRRRRWLSDDYLIVAAPSGGLVTVRLTPPGPDRIMLLPEANMTGGSGATLNAAREQHLRYVGADIEEFVKLLKPFTPHEG